MRVKTGMYTVEGKVEGSVVTLSVELNGRIVAEGTGDTANAASEDIQEKTDVEGIRLTLQGTHLPEPSTTETPAHCSVCGKLIKEGEFWYRLAKAEPAGDGVIDISCLALHQSCATKDDKEMEKLETLV